MTVLKGIYRILACPCGYSALQQEENPKVYHCGHCGRVSTLDGSPPPLTLAIEPITGRDGTYFVTEEARDNWESFTDWKDRFWAESGRVYALPPELLGVKKGTNSDAD